MRVLLDTHTVIWALLDPGKISGKARTTLENPGNSILVSAISFWEISLKSGLGKLCLTGATADDLPGFCEDQGWELLPLDPETAAGYARLPLNPIHRDPFDRMLVCQSISLACPLVSGDKALDVYLESGFKRLW